MTHTRNKIHSFCHDTCVKSSVFSLRNMPNMVFDGLLRMFTQERVITFTLNERQ